MNTTQATSSAAQDTSRAPTKDQPPRASFRILQDAQQLIKQHSKKQSVNLKNLDHQNNFAQKDPCNEDKWVSPYTSESKKPRKKTYSGSKAESKADSSRFNLNTEFLGSLRNANRIERQQTFQ